MVSRYALCAIVKNENPDLLEWITHHHLIGFDTIFIYDNMSDDGTPELVESLMEHIDVRLLRWPQNDPYSQIHAYENCIRYYGHDYDWMAFLDADEFLISSRGETISSLLSRHEGHAGIAINWMIFGSSGMASMDGRLVMETFVRRAEDGFHLNAHVKVIIRPSHFTAVENPHYSQVYGKYYGPDGDDIRWSTTKGVSAEIIHNDWRVHHYIIRSETHWSRRLARGQADQTIRHEEDRILHDRNEVVDTTAAMAAKNVRDFLQARDMLGYTNSGQGVLSPAMIPQSRSIFLDASSLGDAVTALPALYDLAKTCQLRLAVNCPAIRQLWAGPRVTFIDRTPDLVRLTIWNAHVRYYKSDLHMVQSWFWNIGFPIPETAERPILRSDAVGCDGAPDVIISPYSHSDPGNNIKVWDYQLWNTVISQLLDEGLTVAVCGVFSDERNPRFWQDDRVVELDSLPLRRLSELLKAARCVATIDNGVGHLSSLLNTRHVHLIPRHDNLCSENWVRSLSDYSEIIYADFQSLASSTVLSAIEGMTQRVGVRPADPQHVDHAASRHIPKESLAAVGCLDEIGSDGVSGWIVNDNNPAEVLKIAIFIDNLHQFDVVCDGHRPDLLKAGKGTDRGGFFFQIPQTVLPGTEHVLSVRTLLGDTISLSMNGVQHATIPFSLRDEPARRGPILPPVHGRLDDMHQGRFRGWAYRQDDQTGERQGSCVIAVKLNDTVIAEVLADRPRPDVAGEIGTNLRCGFEFVPPSRYAKPYPQTFTFVIMPENLELANSPLTTAFLDFKHLYDMAETADRVLEDVSRWRDAMHNMLPASQFTVEHYDEWARRYQRALRRHVDLARQSQPPSSGSMSMPLVSIIVPVYRPHIPHFEAAVESVVLQTYRHWELILVDDGSGKDDLTEIMAGMALRDRRIKVVLDQPNGGISIATNRAIAEAHGDWIVFFDHDDLLASVAIEVMVRAAQRSGAKMLYSDEDKIDELGHFSEPAFKPDWNLRMLMATNYVCHLLMVRREVVAQVGPLRKEFDGAQDYDMILRLGQAVGSEAILHVPEVLYHWRKTANSTATIVSNKSYAIQAGAAAVAAFALSLGHDTQVESILSTTIYRIRWQFTEEPKVTIIIPFKDGIEMTSRCVNTLLEVTEYKNYDVILVDNGSVTPEARQFCNNILKQTKVRILPVHEEFNYSRLNNLAARLTDAEFFVFMNNDLFVLGGDWLRIMMNEALAAPDVGIVGGKLLYPSGLIQHAGVVLGVHGVAGHVFSGMPGDFAGYAGRAVLAQEMSAVTAACMLMRASVFREVGGFDEEKLKVAFNDVDLCLKAGKAGYRVIFTPDFVAEHHESVSRGTDDDPIKHARFTREVSTMVERWGSLLARDPHYSKQFALNREPYIDLVLPENGFIDLA